MSVTRPIFFPLPGLPPPEVVVDGLLLLLLPPQPATNSATTPRSTSDLFIPSLSAKVCDYGAKTVSEFSSAHPTPAHVSLAVVLQVRDGVLQVLLWQRAQEPFAGSWALPGGYLVPGETLELSIRPHLAEKADGRELAHPEHLR